MPDPLLWRGVLWCSKRHDRFYRVFVFRDAITMRAYWRERAKRVHYRKGGRADRGGNAWEAQATWWHSLTRRAGRLHRDRCCGEILFHGQRIGAGIVSHEMTHAAAFYIAWDRKLDPHPKNGVAHEKLCIVQGSLVSQFWVQFYRKHPGANGKPQRPRRIRPRTR